MQNFLLVFIVSALLLGCSKEAELPESITFVSRNAPTTWYQGKENPQGPEHDLAKSFGQFINRPVTIDIVDSISNVLKTIQNDKAHIAAAGLTITQQRKDNGFVFSDSYQQVEQQVICRRSDTARPKTIDDLIGKSIKVIANSSYVQRLNQLKITHPDLVWTAVDDEDTEQLLEQVWRKHIDCTVADSNIVEINRRYYPELIVAFPLTEAQPIAWVVNQDNAHLKTHINKWLKHIKENGELAAIQEKYYGHIDLFDYVDIRSFKRRIKTRFAKYKDLFEKAAEANNLSPTLLAAQAYQESHWDPKAKSPTGVRGMMMLTKNTAIEMGVTNRIDVTQSINGGAKYLAKMIKRVPKEVTGENRIWFALAAYNIGFGHLHDARTLTERLDKDKNSWVDLKQTLPLLMQKHYYKTLKYGYARGSEAKSYVRHIRDYQQILIESEKL